MDLGLDGAVVLITGGVRGVGAGITRTFLRAGATVVTCARHRPEKGIETDGRAAEFLECDVRDPDRVRELVDTVVARHGRLDVLVNNAGGVAVRARRRTPAPPSFTPRSSSSTCWHR